MQESAHDNLKKWHESLEAAYLNREAYPVTLIKQWIDILRTQDEKVTKTITYGKNFPKRITIRNESKQFVAALEAMLTKNGRAEIPFFNSSGEVTDTIEMYVGGDLLPQIDGRDLKDESGSECQDALCTLKAIYGLDPSAETMTGGSRTPSDAAYDTLFLFFRFQYYVSFQVPKEPFAQSRKIDVQAYEAAKQAHRIPTATEVRVLATTLWKLPPAFSRMPTLTTIHSVVPYSTRNLSDSVSDEFTDSTEGRYFTKHITSGREMATSSWGTITFNRDSWLKFSRPTISVFQIDPLTNDYVARPGAQTGRPETVRLSRPLTDYEIKTFAPDLHEKREFEAQATAVHELSHALDRALFTFGETPQHEFGISNTPSWLNLSGWIYYGATNLTRVIQATYPGMDRHMLGTIELPKVWDVKPDSFTWSYGMVSPKEDFAVAVADYFSEPEKLKSRAPEKYEFIQTRLFTFSIKNRSRSWTYTRPQFLSDLGVTAVRDLRFSEGQGYYDFSRQETRPTQATPRARRP